MTAPPNLQINQPNTVFRNLGGMKFAALTAEAGLTAEATARHRGSAIGISTATASSTWSSALSMLPPKSG